MITIDIWCSHSSDSLLSSLDPSSSSHPLPSFPSCKYSYPLVPLRCQICLVDSSPFLLPDSLFSLPHSVLSPSSFTLIAPFPSILSHFSPCGFSFFLDSNRLFHMLHVACFLQASQPYECSSLQSPALFSPPTH